MTKRAVLAALLLMGLTVPVLAAGAISLSQPGYGRGSSRYTPTIVQTPPAFSGRGVAPVTAPGRLPPPPVLYQNRAIPSTPGM